MNTDEKLALLKSIGMDILIEPQFPVDRDGEIDLLWKAIRALSERIYQEQKLIAFHLESEERRELSYPRAAEFEVHNLQRRVTSLEHAIERKANKLFGRG